MLPMESLEEAFVSDISVVMLIMMTKIASGRGFALH